METRFRWYHKYRDFRWNLVIFTDKYGIKSGLINTYYLCTRNPKEAWYSDCLDLNFKEQTGLIFVGAIATRWRDPYIIYNVEDAGESAAAIKMLKELVYSEWQRRVIK